MTFPPCGVCPSYRPTFGWFRSCESVRDPDQSIYTEKCNKRKHEENYPLWCNLHDKRERTKRSQKTSGNCLCLVDTFEEIILGNVCVSV